jgi:acyl transferase domain-containing protein/thioesterase domain-containing protein
MYQDYGIGVPESPQTDGLSPTGGVGGSAVSGRVSYALDLEGPAVTVDTACSSSLVAMHLACQGLRSGDCSLALAGGVTVLSTPLVFVMMSRPRGLAPDGRCKSFAAGADGTGWSEGVGLLLLERLSDARAKGHRVLALIRGSATNQDGASNGITAPNGPSQERVIRQALANAGLEPADVDAVEAHGTGTTLGDPIEAGALLATYGRGRDPGRPLGLGSIKSNLGHTQAAAGVAGVIKMAMAMRAGRLPRTLHAEQPSPHVDWSSGAVELLSEGREWGRDGRPRRAGVSSFGVSGTNAHLILEEAPPEEKRPEDGSPEAEGEDTIVPWILSARSETALRRRASRLRSHLLEHPEQGVAEVARVLAARPRLERRAAVAGADRAELLDALAALAAGEESGNAVEAAPGPAEPGRPVFLFPGQGAQWRSMATELLGSSPEFARVVGDCEQALEPHVDWSLESILRREAGAADLERVDVVQPVLFSVMVALAALWRSCGVEPAAVVGHSQGEIAAAHVAGGLSLEDAAQLVALRSQVLVLGAGQGAMAIVAAGADDLTARVPPWQELVSLAGINGPGSIVVSGPNAGIDEVLARCEQEGIWTHRIRAAVGAGHSPAVEAGRELLMQAAAGISPRSCEVPFYSSALAGPVDTAELDAEYWYRNAREPVRFGPTIARLLAEGSRRFVEVSPNPILMVPLHEAFAHELGDAVAEASFVPTLRRHRGGLHDFGLAVGTAWANGVEVDWERALPPVVDRPSLPTYPFERRRYWLQAPDSIAGDAAAAGQEPAGHPLLAAAVRPADRDALLLTGSLSLRTHPWLGDHGGMGIVLLPGTAFLELALHAGAEIGWELLRELSLEAPLALPEEGAVQVQVTVSEPDEEGLRAVAIHSRPQPEAGGEGEEWVRHASGLLSPSAAEAGAPPEGPAGGEWPPAGAEAVDLAAFYDDLAARGVDYGPAFQGLRSAWRRGEELFVEVALADGEAREADAFGLHPALLDAALHASAIAYMAEEDEGPAGPRLPFSFADVSLHSRGAASLRAALSRDGEGLLSLRAWDERGATLASIGSLVVRLPPAEYFAASAVAADALFSLDWLAVEPAAAPAAVAAVGSGAEALATGLGGVASYPDFEALVTALEAGAPAPEVALLSLPDGSAASGAGVPAGVRAAVAEALAAAQAWLGDERLAGVRLAFLTRGAVAVRPGERIADLGQAACWGLLRTAQSEHPGRFLLVDLDGTAPAEALPSALRSGEAQLALREGELLAPRLRRLSPAAEPAAPALDPDGTVLVTGGTGDLGGLFARHLVAEHGVRHLVLASRSGAEAAAAAGLVAGLEELGASARVARCDVSDRAQVAALLDSVDPAHPLTAVVHTAAVLDDGVFESMTAERLERALEPKADAAWHLHELTAGADLDAFVLFSSGAGTLGMPGQANYAAANAFLDALAADRSARGLAATAIVWGLWERTLRRGEEAMDERDLARVSRSGVAPIADRQGFELFDAALAHERAVVSAVRLDLAAWRARAGAEEVPPVLRELVRAPRRAPGEEAVESLPGLLADVPPAAREEAALEFARRLLADVLGYDAPTEVDPDRPFLELGFDSLTALQLRNRLNASTGLRLTPSVALDHPTPRALAAHVLARLDLDAADAAPAASGAVLASLLRKAHRDGRTAEFLSLLDGISSHRQSFASPAESGVDPYALRLAEGAQRPALVCVPSAAPISGPHEYARLASRFRGERDLWALRWPGFAELEAVPASAEAAIELQAAALDHALGDDPVVLLGHSTGGAFAYGLARHLEQAGRPPAGLVLIDGYHPAQAGLAAAPDEAAGSVGIGILGSLLELGESSVVIDDVRLTAMASYLRLVSGVQVAGLGAPVLLIRATEPIGAAPDGAEWRPRWDLPHEVVDVPGNHLTMMDAHAELTAAAIADWLESTAAKGAIPPQTE